MKIKRLIVSACAAVGIAAAVSAAPVDSAAARAVAENWMRSNGDVFGGDGGVADVRVERDGAGKILWWNVVTKSGGAVIVSADTGIEPIVGVVGTFGEGIPAGHPLRALLMRDMQGRLASVKARGQKPQINNRMLVASSGGGDALDAEMARAEKKWRRLGGVAPKVTNSLLVASAPPITEGYPSVMYNMSDEFWEDGHYTHWNQSWLQFLDGKYNYYEGGVYNFHTPKKYVTGCVAVCGAALLQYFGVNNGLPAGIYQCKVDEEDRSYSMGAQTYDWSILPEEMGGEAENPSDGNLTYAQKDLLSRVPYHVGLSVEASYHEVYTGASPQMLTTALRDTFGFADMRTIYDYDPIAGKLFVKPEHYEKFIYAQMRAGAPVVLSIEDEVRGGHAVLGVGYGEDEFGTPYTRLFMGWSGMHDA